MLSTPFTSCSIGVATVSDSTCADAPGYAARILTVGGAMSGYSETGSARCTIAPAIVRMIDSTAAKIGRSMKKWDRRMGLVARRLILARLDLARLGRNHRAGAHERIGEAAHHHAVGGLQARSDDAKPEREAAEGDLLDDDLVVRPDREHRLARLVRDDGVVGNEQRVDGSAVELQPPEGAGAEE